MRKNSLYLSLLPMRIYRLSEDYYTFLMVSACLGVGSRKAASALLPVSVTNNPKTTTKTKQSAVRKYLR